MEIPGKVKVVEGDSDDDALLETAMVGGVDYLISGDPHLLKLREFSILPQAFPKNTKNSAQQSL